MGLRGGVRVDCFSTVLTTVHQSLNDVARLRIPLVLYVFTIFIFVTCIFSFYDENLFNLCVHHHHTRAPVFPLWRMGVA